MKYVFFYYNACSVIKMYNWNVNKYISFERYDFWYFIKDLAHVGTSTKCKMDSGHGKLFSLPPSSTIMHFNVS